MKKSFLSALFGIGILIAAMGSKIGYPQSSDYIVKDMVSMIGEQQKQDTAVKSVYTCSMHPEVISDKPGKCPKCGMNLITKEVKKDVFTCPMHSEIIQDKAGKCPKCGMNLVKKEPAKKSGSAQQ